MTRVLNLIGFFVGLVSCSLCVAQQPIAGNDLVFAEKDGLVAVEAEHFFQQTKNEKRAFYLTHADETPTVKPDGDAAHVGGASGGAYLEILPDTRRTHGDKLIKGENFSPVAGQMAILSYKVNFSNPGRYYVWVRAHSTGSEDNGLHVGLNGEWPATGQRLQWCQGKRSWYWESKQRTEKQHCGEPYKIFLDIEKAGLHTISFSMREDGFEFDKWLMTKDRNFKRPGDAGPKPVAHSGKMPKAFKLVAAPKTEQAPTQSASTSPTNPVSDRPLHMPRGNDGDGSISVLGEKKTWHKVTLAMNGPYAHEQDNEPNPFTDYNFFVKFGHEDGTLYKVPGFFAADGDAANSSAESGTKWHVHFAPDRPGKWDYEVFFYSGKNCALLPSVDMKPVKKFAGHTGSFEIEPTDKNGRDMRAKGRFGVRRQTLPKAPGQR